MTKRIFIIEIEDTGDGFFDTPAESLDEIFKTLNVLNRDWIPTRFKMTEVDPVEGLTIRRDDIYARVNGWEKPWEDMSKSAVERTRLWMEHKNPTIEASRWYDRVKLTRKEFEDALNELVKEGVVKKEDQVCCERCGSSVDPDLDSYCMDCVNPNTFEPLYDDMPTKIKTLYSLANS